MGTILITLKIQVKAKQRKNIVNIGPFKLLMLHLTGNHLFIILNETETLTKYQKNDVLYNPLAHFAIKIHQRTAPLRDIRFVKYKIKKFPNFSKF